MRFPTITRRRGSPRSIVAALSLLFASSLFLAACGGGDFGEAAGQSGSSTDPGTPGQTDPQTATVTINVGGSGGFNALTGFTFADVLRVDVRVVAQGNDPNILANVLGSTVLSPAAFTGTISGLPTGTPLDFHGDGFDAAPTGGVLLYTTDPTNTNVVPAASPTTLTLSGSGDAVDLSMGAVDDGIAYTIPSITGISLVEFSPDINGAITIGETVSLVFDLAGGSAETLTVGLDPDISTGTVTNATWINPTATLTIGAHGFRVGNAITVAGVSAGFNTPLAIITGVTATTVGYTLATDPGTGSTGTVDLADPITPAIAADLNVLMDANGVGSQGYDYTAQGTSNVYPHRIRVTNVQGNATEAALTISVGTSNSVSVNFAPTITSGSLLGARTLEDTATVDVTVSDDDALTLLTYTWAYTGAGSFINNVLDDPLGTANPGQITGLTNTGPLLVTVAAWLTGTATLTIGTHGFSVGDTITVIGALPLGWNTSRVALTGTTASTVSYALGTNPGAMTTFGTVLNEGILTLTVEDAGFDGLPATTGDNLSTTIIIPIGIPANLSIP